MQFYIPNSPASRLRHWRSAVFKLGLAALVMLGLLAFTQAAYAAHTLNLKFDQSAYKGDVWLQIQDPFYNTVTTTTPRIFKGLIPMARGRIRLISKELLHLRPMTRSLCPCRSSSPTSGPAA